MKNVLVIGCGNIGALYDIGKDEILTHVKAISLNTNFNLTIFDNDPMILQTLKLKYNCNVITKINNFEDLNDFDLINICTPTDTHYDFLTKGLLSKSSLILCEKPVSYSLLELEKLKDLYLKSTKKVLVNYTRRFQPKYITIKEKLNSLIKTEKLTNINIRYQRGFLNNCSHALDILSYLINFKIDFNNFIITKSTFDTFELDPTISAFGCQNSIDVSIIGLANVKFSFFEIDIFFENTRLSLIDSGKNCIISNSNTNSKYFQPLKVNYELSLNDCLRDQMKFLIDSAYNFLNNENLNDNFLESVELNTKMLNFINK